MIEAVMPCALAATVVLAVCSPATGNGLRPATPAPTVAAGSVAARGLLEGDAASILAHHVAAPGGGWAWRSAIQAPNLQTDRDVGAAGVGVGLLAAYQTTGVRADLEGAEQAADWLLAVARPAGGGLRWPDHVNGPGRYSPPYFTSFDDGAIGIADFLWRLQEIDSRSVYRNAALAALSFEESEARGAGGHPCPEVCTWRWADEAGQETFTGMGQGVAGIGYAFDLFAARTGDASYRACATGAAAYLESQISTAGAMPEHPGGHGYDTGFLNGSAGDAVFFLDLYRDTHDPRWLADAERLLAWVAGQEVPALAGVGWPIEVGPEANPAHALGTEEGNAGIGWAFLQAYLDTGRSSYLDTAVTAGEYILAAAVPQDGGLAWPEDAGTAVFHTSLDNGASGIGYFLVDLASATGQPRFSEAAAAVVPWLSAVSHSDERGTWWYDERRRGRWHFPREMSWHWGSAGIATFLSRLAGWNVDMPVEEAGGP